MEVLKVENASVNGEAFEETHVVPDNGNDPSETTAEEKILLNDIKTYAEKVRVFSEKFGKSVISPEGRVPPMFVFVKNYLRHYSHSLLDNIHEIESHNSASRSKAMLITLKEDFHRLHASFLSVFNEEPIADDARKTVDEMKTEGIHF